MEPEQPILPVLICFAVKEEASHFVPLAARDARLSILITGIGPANARAKLREALDRTRLRQVVTSGFAGGLNPKLSAGQIVFDAEPETGLENRLAQSGGIAGRFYCAEQVAVTSAEKAQLWKSTGADAVEMESGVIRALCRERKIPSATVRVLSDAADEDLPLDFNALMTPDQRIDYARLGLRVVTRPWKIPAIMRFHKQTSLAARRLAAVLNAVLSPAG